MTKLTTKKRNKIGDGQFAFSDQRKEPLENASHVRNAAARFSQVKGASNDERDAAWSRIRAAAKKFGVKIQQSNWRDV